MSELQDLFTKFEVANAAGDAASAVALLRKLMAEATAIGGADGEIPDALRHAAWNPKDVPAERLISKRDAAKVETLEAQLSGGLHKREPVAKAHVVAWPVRPKFTFRR